MIDWKKYPHFTEREFACKCCGKVVVATELLEKLETARTLSNVPFHITSGYRCPEHNRAVGGVADSAHTRGCAADISTPDNVTRMHVMEGIMVADFNRIGIDSGFIHVDVDPRLPSPALWLYKRD